MRKLSGKELGVKILIYVVLAILAILIIVPLAWTVMSSLKTNNDFIRNPVGLPTEGLQWENYVNAWTKAKMGDFFLNSIIVTLLGLALLLVMALPASYCLARFKFPLRGVINTAFMGGLFVNVSYIVVPIFLMLNGWDKSLRTNFDVAFFLNNKFILALVLASTALPFTIYLLSGYFVTLPKDFEEAAYVDGSSYFHTMTRIMVPMAKPSIITVILFNFLAFWNEYIVSITLMTKEEQYTLPVGLMSLNQASMQKAEWGRLFAGMVIVMLPVLIIYMFVQKRLTEGMTAGGVKG